MSDLTLRELEQLTARVRSLEKKTPSNRVQGRAEDVRIAIEALRLELLRERSRTLQESGLNPKPDLGEIPRRIGDPPFSNYD